MACRVLRQGLLFVPKDALAYAPGCKFLSRSGTEYYIKGMDRPIVLYKCLPAQSPLTNVVHRP